MNINDDKLLETLGKMMISELGRDFSKDDLKSLLRLSELVVEIASGEFKCNSCKGAFKIYAISK